MDERWASSLHIAVLISVLDSRCWQNFYLRMAEADSLSASGCFDSGAGAQLRGYGGVRRPP